MLATVAETTTAGAARFAEKAAASGATGLMVLPGMQYVSDRREAVTHLRTVARAVDLPIMLYSNPVAYRVDVDLLALEELAGEANVVAIKESSDDVRRVTDTAPASARASASLRASTISLWKASRWGPTAGWRAW